MNEKGKIKRLDAFGIFSPSNTTPSEISDSMGATANLKNGYGNEKLGIKTPNRKPTGSGYRNTQSGRTWNWSRHCENCGYRTDKIKEKRVKRRRCPRCRRNLKAMSRTKIDKKIASSKLIKIEADCEILWSKHDKKIMAERYRIAKKHKTKSDVFKRQLIDIVGIPLKASTLITNYFYQKDYLKSIIRK